MISPKMASRLNEQINKEMASAYLYMAMSAVMTEAGYKGVAKWLMIQYHEEMYHAMKFYEYLGDQGATVSLGSIQIGAVKEKTVKDVFTKVLEHEKGVTASIREIAELALAEKDFATQGFIGWFVSEQVEEEKNASEILQTIDLVGNSAHGIFLVNVELGKRGLSVPSDFTGMSGAH